MATILLQAAGAFVGGFLGSAGAAIGTAAGALAGYVIDRALIEGTRHYQGPRLSGPRPLVAEEGQPIPRVYGTARLGATLIWATRFEERRQTERQGSKGGPKVTNYSYFANAAFALCEGEIACVRRIWADGREIDREQVEIRVHRGTAGQAPDPLIEAKQGAGNAPAYRGTAYVVVERLPLASYGNRIPQFQFEVARPVGALNGAIRAVALIPGATEFGLSPLPVTRTAGKFWDFGEVAGGARETLNRSMIFAASDLVASLDELQALCPNLERVALVVAWFGDDLRAGRCTIRPKVMHASAPAASRPWTVSGLAQNQAREVTRHDGKPAYGGTPSDRSVLDAIAELRSRGIRVTLYPFVMMDIATDNTLPDPAGGTGQPAYPWRGRITCDPAPGAEGSADRTAKAAEQVAAFCGSAEPAHFSPAGDTVVFRGAHDDWGYRRMVLHYAKLAVLAGGVDGFLIGSELGGLTRVRDGDGAYPFVGELVRLAEDVRGVLGARGTITYGADWSEYFGHHPDDGSGDVNFHLDPLWASPAIGAVGIDNYMPLSDWRDGDIGGASPDGAASACDARALRAAIAGGEGFDWYYASLGDRMARLRTPITDGAHDKPWVFRFKDLQGWWRNPHFDRRGGVEQAVPTAWIPCSKPFWFTELGCAAIDKGPNQPNLFADPKSSEGAVPWFSHGGRDDHAQRAFLSAHLAHWDPEHPLFDESANPVSPVYGGPMVDPAHIYLWCWDARPYPAFPLDGDRWSDGGNWPCGHWLNGRLAGVGLGDLINAVLADHGLPPADVTRVSGSLAGHVVDGPASARSIIEPLADLYGLAARESGTSLVLFDENAPPDAPVPLDGLVVPEDGPAIVAQRDPAEELPGEIVLQFRDPMRDYQVATVRFGAAGPGPAPGQRVVSLAAVLDTGTGEALAAGWMRRQRAGRDRICFHLPHAARGIGPGTVIAHPFAGATASFIVTAIEEGISRRVEARRVAMLPSLPASGWLPGRSGEASDPSGPPLALFLDLPMVGTGEPRNGLRVAAWRMPWRSLVVSASPERSGFSERSAITRPATIAMLETPLAAGPVGRLDHAGVLNLRVLGGEFASVSMPQLMNGANVLAVRSLAGSWELLQFAGAEEIAPSRWRLSGLLRGQLGTEDASAAGAAAGVHAVLIDEAVVAAGLLASEIGLDLHWRVQPAGLVSAAADMAESVEAGGLRALLPLAPVHLSARRAPDGGMLFRWIRRSRIDADSWLAADIPLGEESEAWRLRVRDVAGALLAEHTLSGPSWHYTAAAMAADLPPAAEFIVEIRQLSAAVGEGIAATRRFSYAMTIEQGSNP